MAEASAAIDAALQSADPGVILGMLDSLTSVPLAAWLSRPAKVQLCWCIMLRPRTTRLARRKPTRRSLRQRAVVLEARSVRISSAVPWPCLVLIAGSEGGLGYCRNRCWQPGPRPMLPMWNLHLAAVAVSHASCVRGLQKFGSVVTEVLKSSGTNGSATADAASADQASDALTNVLEAAQARFSIVFFHSPLTSLTVFSCLVLSGISAVSDFAPG